MKNRLLISTILVIVSSSLIWPISPIMAKTFRWVDENGKVHYSDHMPPNEADRGFSVINQQGVTINKVEQAKTPEQLEQEQRLQQLQIEQERLAREKAVRDHILLDTYVTVSDLEETRDRHITTLEGQIEVSEHKLENINREFEKLNLTAANLERDGKAVPDDLAKDIANLQAQIEREKGFIQAQRAQQKEFREKFAADIQRFKELKAGQHSKN